MWLAALGVAGVRGVAAQTSPLPIQAPAARDAPAGGARSHGTACVLPRRCASFASGAQTTPALPAPPWGGGEGPGPEKAFLLSAALPGTGQYLQGQRRWVAYAAAELVGWILVLDRRHDGSLLRDRYRDMAWNVAREGLSESPRMDGDFTYYETVEHWERSGTFDRDPALGGVQPETDPATFNGSIWALARAIYFPEGAPAPVEGDSLYAEALAYYEARAYDPRFRWDWSSDPVAWRRYGDTIKASDDRFRQVTLFTGAIMANHLLSGVDAFVSARLRRASGAPISVTSRVAPAGAQDPAGLRMELSLSWHGGAP